MAFAVRRFFAYGQLNDNPTIKRGVQVVQLAITGLNTDVAYDLGTVAGTFWTSAIADAIYGQIATAARDFILTALTKNVAQVLAIQSQQLVARLQAAAASGTSYVQTVAAVTTPTPELLFASGNAPTSGTFLITWNLADNVEPITASYG